MRAGKGNKVGKSIFETFCGPPSAKKYKHNLFGDYTLFLGYELILGTYNTLEMQQKVEYTCMYGAEI